MLEEGTLEPNQHQLALGSGARQATEHGHRDVHHCSTVHFGDDRGAGFEELREGQEVVVKDGYLPLPAAIAAEELAKLD